MKNLRNFTSDGTVDTHAVDKYSGMNRDQLMTELFSKVAEAKNSGSFNPKELDGFYEFMSPHLDAEQKRRLSALISEVKKQK